MNTMKLIPYLILTTLEKKKKKKTSDPKHAIAIRKRK